MGLLSRNKDPSLKEEARSTPVRLIVMFSGVPDFDPKEYADLFRKHWNKKITCEKSPAQDDPEVGIRRYAVTVENTQLSLAFVSMPLSNDVIQVIERMTAMSALPFQISELQSKALHDHVTHAVIETKITENLEKPMLGIASAWAMLELLITLMEQFDGMTGYVPVSAQVYHSKDWLRDMVRSRQIQQSDLFIYLCNIHFIADSENWVHTHGMEQFGLPDIEARFTGREQAARYTNLVGDAAMYTIDTAVITTGNTLELSGDGVVHKVVGSKQVPDHSYGAFGAIAIEKK